MALRQVFSVAALLIQCVTAISVSTTPGFAADFPVCIASLKGEAALAGVTGDAFNSATANLQPDQTVLEFQKDQPEFKTPIWDYLSGLVDDQRVEDGRNKLKAYAGAFTLAENRFGVDRNVIAAVWGVESDFGRSMGKRPLLQSLGTLACYGARSDYFRREFVAALKIIANGDIRPEKLTGSWAGAFGQTQFMPSTFLRLAVDLDGDGRRDIVDSVPDSLGSTANFLEKAGWRTGMPWGFEVKIPPSYSGPSGRSLKAPMSVWQARGIRRIDGGALGEGNAGLLLPAGREGPAFLVTSNFDAIFSYNAAEAYALAIVHLADRLAGGGPFVTPWPTDDPGLSRAERREVQTLLAQRGYEVGDPDGAIGAKSKQAIEQYQQKIGLGQNGRASRAILVALREGR